MRIISQRVAPSACAPSCSLRGVCEKTSRATAETIGRIITREDQADDQHRAAGDRGGPFEDRQEAELFFQPLHHRHGGRAEHEDAPEAVDDARDRGQQVDQVAEREGDPRRRDVGDEERDGDRQRHREDHRQDAGEHGAEGERRDVVDEALRRSGSSEADAVSAGKPSLSEEGRDPGEQRQDRHRGDHRGVAEDPVAPAAAPSGRRRQELAGIGRGVELSHESCVEVRGLFDRADGGFDLFGQRRRERRGAGGFSGQLPALRG